MKESEAKKGQRTNSTINVLCCMILPKTTKAINSIQPAFDAKGSSAQQLGRPAANAVVSITQKSSNYSVDSAGEKDSDAHIHAYIILPAHSAFHCRQNIYWLSRLIKLNPMRLAAPFEFVRSANQNTD